MTMTDQEVAQAEERMAALRQTSYAVAARYDRGEARVVVTLNTDVEINFPAQLAEGLHNASPDDLAEIEISPSGLGLHWPKLDADLYVPGLLAGQLGSRRWMAQMLGAAGGEARSEAKTAAARENGKKGGRPAKTIAVRNTAPTAAPRKTASDETIAVKKRSLAKQKALTTAEKLERAKKLLAAKGETRKMTWPKRKRHAAR
jgi:hypothetical protein